MMNLADSAARPRPEGPRENTNVARKRSLEVVSQEIGYVVDPAVARYGAPSEHGALWVRAESGDYEAKRAVSCLVEPAIDDIVLLALAPHGAAYVLAVLERREGARRTLSTEGDLEIRQRHGRVTIAAQEGVDLVSAKEVSVIGHGLRVTATEGNVVVDKLAFVGGVLRAELDRVKVLAQTLDSVLDRFSQRVRNAYRTVEESDQLRAGRIDYASRSTMSLHGENALVTAEQLVKVDGEQIHLG